MIKRCIDCRAFAIDARNLEAGQCRANPPTVFPIPMQGAAGLQIQFISAWPNVKKDDHCEKFEVKSL